MVQKQVKPVFLKARWQYLAMVNYTVPPILLVPYVPKGTELDLWDGQAMVSLVGFLFNDTRVFGIRWPFHTHFEEVNLRLYIKRKDGNIWKRGVAFVSEIVPKHAIALIANQLYNEHYRYMPMRHTLIKSAESLLIEYGWKHQGQWNSLQMTAGKEPLHVEEGSAEWFIFEHYWGYNQLNPTQTVEYGVEHPRWMIYPIKDYKLDCDIAAVYGSEWVDALSAPPHSVMLAYGSEVIVRKPVVLEVG